MKKFTSIILVAVFVSVVSPQITYSAFPYRTKAKQEQKKNSLVNAIAAPAVEKNVSVFSNIASGSSELNYKAPEHAGGGAGGGMGIASFVCAIVGLIVLAIPLGILAIIFGILGMQGNRPYRGLAKAGFIIGIIDVVVGLIVLIAIASLAII